MAFGFYGFYFTDVKELLQNATRVVSHVSTELHNSFWYNYRKKKHPISGDYYNAKRLLEEYAQENELNTSCQIFLRLMDAVDRYNHCIYRIEERAKELELIEAIKKIEMKFSNEESENFCDWFEKLSEAVYERARKDCRLGDIKSEIDTCLSEFSDSISII